MQALKVVKSDSNVVSGMFEDKRHSLSSTESDPARASTMVMQSPTMMSPMASPISVGSPRSPRLIRQQSEMAAPDRQQRLMRWNSQVNEGSSKNVFQFPEVRSQRRKLPQAPSLATSQVARQLSLVEVERGMRSPMRQQSSLIVEDDRMNSNRQWGSNSVRSELATIQSGSIDSNESLL